MRNRLLAVLATSLFILGAGPSASMAMSEADCTPEILGYKHCLA